MAVFGKKAPSPRIVVPDFMEMLSDAMLVSAQSAGQVLAGNIGQETLDALIDAGSRWAWLQNQPQGHRLGDYPTNYINALAEMIVGVKAGDLAAAQEGATFIQSEAQRLTGNS